MDRRNAKMKIYAIISTLAAVLFLGLFLAAQIPITTGGGQGESAPDAAFIAQASSLKENNPLARGFGKTYYEFTVARIGSQPFERLFIYPSEQRDQMYFRTLPQIITWAPDSSQVTFNIPGATLKLDAHRTQD
jgi:hypothetical protein